MINKTLILGGLIGSLCASNIPLTTTNNTSTIVEQEESQAEEECTVMYVGKKVSKDGKAMIARSADASPTGMNLNMQIFNHNYLANQTVRGKNGFAWKMPSTTYKYISTPRNPRVNKGLHWEASAINEMGVGVSAVLTCHSNEHTALEADPMVPTGISEDNIAQVLGAVSTSARQGMEYLADILDKEGSSEQSSILTIDKDEVWFMEIYTGHQYVAIKLPDDKVCTIGNEFMLDSLATVFGEDVEIENNRNIIYSPGLFSLPQTGAHGVEPFAEYDQDHAGEDKHLNLFATYARPLDDLEIKIETDYSHRRTWRGFDLFAKGRRTGDLYEYKTEVKYPSFFEPEKWLGTEDVITFMRDRFEDILTDPRNINHDAFLSDYLAGHLRNISLETAYQIHIIKVNPEFDKEMAVEEWLCLSNSSYSPFIPFSNGITKLNKYYSHKSPSYGYDPDSAYCIFKNLNMLASGDEEARFYYGIPVENFWTYFEDLWRQQWQQILDGIKGMRVSKAKEILSNFCQIKQIEAINQAKSLSEDLSWHIINDTKSYEPVITTFQPTIKVEDYAKLFGWSYYRNGTNVTLTNGNEHVYVDCDYYWNKPGQIRRENEDWVPCNVSLKNDEPSIDIELAYDYLAKGHKMVPINVNDYITKFDPLVWVIPLVIVVIVGAWATIYLVRRKKSIKEILEIDNEE